MSPAWLRAAPALTLEQRVDGARQTAVMLTISSRSQSAVGFVYFIAAGPGHVKIGLALEPTARLAELQTGNHVPLELLATVKGGRVAERAYHARFAAHRLHGEWFARVPEIEAEIAYLERTKVAA